MYVVRGEQFDVCFESGWTGWLGTVTLQIIDNQGGITQSPSPLNIVESPAGSGTYCATRTAPLVVGQYTLSWSLDGTYSDNMTSIDDLVIVASASVLPAPLPPIASGAGSQAGPYSAWTTADDVANCCNVEIGSDVDVFDEVVDKASQVLFELSGRKYLGTGTKTVWPACDSCVCGYQILSRGHIVGPWDWGVYTSLCDACTVVCDPSRVKLSGFPVRTVDQVKIDGSILAPTEYRLDLHRYVTRLNDTRWPLRNDWTRADTEDGTWTITYTFGEDPPLAGRNAAQQLACELYKACAGQECALPTGATRVTRQGITIERQFFQRDRTTGSWRTGLSMVDMFLNAYNPSGLIRTPVFWAPGRRRYAQELG